MRSDKYYKWGKISSERPLNEFEVFIRHSRAVPIIRKINRIEHSKYNLNKVISPSKPFGLRGHYEPTKSGVPCHFTQKQGFLLRKMMSLTA